MPIRSRPDGSDDQLREEISTKQGELRTFRRGRRFREDSLDGLAAAIAATREQFSREIQSRGLGLDGGPPGIEQLLRLHGLWAASHDAAFSKAVQKAVADADPPAGAPVFSDLTRKEFEAEEAKRERAIKLLEDELRLRALEQREQALLAERAELEERAGVREEAKV